MREQIPQSVAVVDLEIAPFVNADQAKAWACGHGVPGLMSDVDTRGKGEISISLTSLEKMLSGSAVRKSVTPAIHYAALMRVRDIIRESFVAEIHPDYKKVNGVRSVSNGINPMLQIAVLYGAVSLAGIVYRAKTTLKLYRDPAVPTKAYSYEISNIEVLTGTARVVTLPNVLTSISVDILLNGVRRVNGDFFVKSAFAYGADEARVALSEWLTGKSHVVLVTGGASYSRCGAESFLNGLFQEFTSGTESLTITRLVVSSANPKVEIVQPLLDAIRGPVDGFIAVGGGTVIDTAKILNLAWVLKTDVKSVLKLQLAPPTLLPFFAIPTTAGTGAEATRFAVCYDGETKHSIDFEVIRPTDVALVPDFVTTLPAYQKAATNFDAYAQAVESLWANGATEESRAYARRAMSYIQSGDWCRASYWAGRAIDISRTTAAHAFSYYLTAHYGIPHGAAVYMVFPYICINNGHPEYCRHSAHLKTLREFAKEKGLDWSQLVDDLFAHVNLKRLGNNPVEVRKASFAE